MREEEEKKIRDPGAGMGGKKKIRKENKVSGPIEWSSGLSPDSCSVHYYVSKKTDNSNTQAHTHARTGSISPTNASLSKGNETGLQ